MNIATLLFLLMVSLVKLNDIIFMTILEYVKIMATWL